MRRSILRLAAILVAVGLLALMVVASPTSARGKTYSVDVDGAVDTAFDTEGNNKGSRFHDHEVPPPTLDLDFDDVDGNAVSTHPNFACSPVNQPLDDAAWDFHVMKIVKGDLTIRFGIRVECAAGGLDNYVLIIHLVAEDPNLKAGPGTYTDSDAHITIHHFAQKDNPDHPPGPRKLTDVGHCCDTPFVHTTGSVTVTITELP